MRDFLRRREFIRKLRAEYPALIDAVVDEGGGARGNGYWIYLKDGWILEPDGTHLIHEFTVKELRAALARVERCHCEECGGPPLVHHELTASPEEGYLE